MDNYLSKNYKQSPLTKRQKILYDSILYHIYAYGFPPTRKELTNYLLVKSTKGVGEQLSLIQKKGYIKIHEGVPRGVQVLNKGEAK